MLNIGSIRIYILTIGVVSNETNEDVRMYIEEFILVEVVTLLYKLKMDMHWKFTGIYTIATIHEKCENCSLELIDK